MARTLHIGHAGKKRFELPLDAVTQTFGILARKGAGKTYGAGVMAEELLKAGQQIVILDPIGAWWGLRSKFPIAILGGDHADIPIRPTSGAEIARFVVNERLSVLIDVTEFGVSESRQFVADFAGTFYKLNRDPVHLFLEEADEFIPQQPREKGGPLPKCMNAINRLVRRGRQRGIGVTLITQRSAVINKDVLYMTECLVAMQITAPGDQDAIEGWIKHQGDKEYRTKIMSTLAGFQPGEAWLYSPGWLRELTRIRFRRKESFDSSATPKAGEERQQPKTLAEVDLGALEKQMAEVVEEAKANDPKQLKVEIVKLRKELAAAPAASPGLTDTQLQRFLSEALEKRDAEWREAACEYARQVAELIQAGRSLTFVAPKSWKPPTKAGVEFDIPKQKSRPAPRGPKPSTSANGKHEPAEGVSRPQQAILDALAWFESVGMDSVSKINVAAVAGVSSRSSAFSNNLGGLRSQLGLIDYPDKGMVALTAAGREAANSPEALMGLEDLHRAWLESPALSGPQRNLLGILIADPDKTFSREDLANAAGVSERSSAFSNNLGRLSTTGLIRYPDPGYVTVNEATLFPEGMS